MVRLRLRTAAAAVVAATGLRTRTALAVVITTGVRVRTALAVVVASGLRVRTALAVVVATGAVLLATAAPAAGHGSLVLTVHDDGRGSVSVDVLWADGHPVTEPLAGTFTAVSTAGAQVGPAPLTRLPDRSAVVYGGTLKPGHWTVTVDVALPGIGHCAAPVTVAATAEPHSTRCGNTSPPPAAPVVAAAPDGGNRPGPPWLLFGAAGAIVLGTAAAIMISRRRP